MSQQLYEDFVQDDFYALKPCSGSVMLKEIAKEKEKLAPPPRGVVGCIQWKPVSACTLPNVHDFQRKVCEDSANGTTFSESKFVTCYDHESGQPKLYEATKQTISAQNGVRQVVRTEKDQAAHSEKMSVGRHIKGKSHVEERQRNTQTGQCNRINKYFNMSEVEKRHFPEEWRNKTSGLTLEFARDPFEKMNFSNAVEYYE